MFVVFPENSHKIPLLIDIRTIVFYETVSSFIVIVYQVIFSIPSSTITTFFIIEPKNFKNRKNVHGPSSQPVEKNNKLKMKIKTQQTFQENFHLGSNLQSSKNIKGCFLQVNLCHML